ncbi:unnamed protein product [Ambrosiozyma monospora]|uniref:Unnamed protein product n=1 Tax=Ambrosiozyma monospora TaxID=43982 RepID=A0A9W6Z489_AMBMO|nr:unnamed protein product [Ambrosiozyma monospora]
MSIFPHQLGYLKFESHHHFLNGQFPSNLRSLNINIDDLFEEMYEPFQFICNTFLSSLQNLRILKVETKKSHSLDLRSVQLPKHLTSLELDMEYMESAFIARDEPFVVLDSGVFPMNLESNFIRFVIEANEYATIVVDDWIGANFESVKGKIQVDELFLPHWRLCDHDYSGLENNLF